MRILPRILLALAVLTAVCTDSTAIPVEVIPDHDYTVLRTLPHDPEAFTQGLIYHDDRLFESTGRYGLSELRKVEWSSGKVMQSRPLAPDMFGEGIALIHNRIYQLTWLSRYCLISDADTLKPLRIIPITFSRQGWGLAWDGHSLIASDGSDKLYFLDPVDLSPRRTLNVTAAGRPVSYLNELEIFEGRILANIWQDTRIAEISSLSGRVTAWINCAGLVPSQLRNDREKVLNGIARGPQKGQLFITGKQWPVLYLIELKPRS